MTKINCTKFNACYKINMILDKDMLPFQYTDTIKSVCAACEKRAPKDRMGGQLK